MSSDPANDASPATPPTGLLLAALAAIAVLIGWDLSTDYGEGAGALHLVLELSVLLLATGLFTLILVQRLRAGRRMDQLERSLSVRTEQADAWRARYQQTLAGLGEAIHAQFRAWRLSEAEAQIGLLLLKGLSLKEIAAVRGTGERTVREQARAIYRKAGLAGRSELSAFFLEDLLLPAPTDDVDEGVDAVTGDRQDGP
ncbi:helix-turn-helix transcriptional regulator [Wenzhouxiangella sp. XN79A]|uniref:helix-turn-helix transcriptional regulator n=1 Tax=Wenzhouxiangella sp. XN79A TaxID=2724193 RepID=UPI00197D0BBA|nr:helix-turn-helix transcriptional regulator [Wenzhouxiangella sp. XN79A]